MPETTSRIPEGLRERALLQWLDKHQAARYHEPNTRGCDRFHRGPCEDDFLWRTLRRYYMHRLENDVVETEDILRPHE